MIAVRLWAAPAVDTLQESKSTFYTLYYYITLCASRCKSEYYIYIYWKSRGKWMMEGFEHTVHLL